MNRTITNYQKAYRKKVEGLKVELGAARTDNSRLKAEVRRLRRKKVVHMPSLALGLLGGWLTQKFVARVIEALRSPPSSSQRPAASAAAAAAPAAPAAPVEAAAAAAAAAPPPPAEVPAAAAAPEAGAGAEAEAAGAGDAAAAEAAAE
jgi:hypothetical protein